MKNILFGLLCLALLSAGCDSTTKDPGTTNTETVGDKEPASQNTDTAIPEGSYKVQLHLTLDGMDLQIDSAFCRIAQGFSLEGYGKRDNQGAYAFPHFVKIHSRNFHNIGDYKLDDGEDGTYIWLHQSFYAVGYPEASDKGTLQIKDWPNGRWGGSFQFWAAGVNGKRQHVKGEFNY